MTTRRTFAVGDEVRFLNNPAIVRFVGPTKLSDSKDMVGIELQATTNEGLGKDGSLGGTQYFACPMGKGKFVNPILLRRPKAGSATRRGAPPAKPRVAASSSASKASALKAEAPKAAGAKFAVGARVAHPAKRRTPPPLATVRWVGSLGAAAEAVAGYSALPSSALDAYIGLEYDEKIGSCNGSIAGEEKFEGQFDHCIFMHASAAVAELKPVSAEEDRRITDRVRKQARVQRRGARNRRQSFASGMVGSAAHGVPLSPLATLGDVEVSSDEEEEDDEDGVVADAAGSSTAALARATRDALDGAAVDENGEEWRRRGAAGGAAGGAVGGAPRDTTAKIEHVRRLAARTFEAIDKNNNGWLSKEELQETWLEGQQESDLDAEIEQMGGDVRTGRLHKQHFVAHVMNTYESHSSERMRREVTKELQRYLRHALQQQEEMMKKSELENLRVEKAQLTEKLSEMHVLVDSFKLKGRQAKSQLQRLRQQQQLTEQRCAAAQKERDAAQAAIARIEDAAAADPASPRRGGSVGSSPGRGGSGGSAADIAQLRRRIVELEAENSSLLLSLKQEQQKYAELQADYTQLECEMQQVRSPFLLFAGF